MVSIPALTPYTIPPDTVAVALDAVQVPPAVPLDVNVTLDPVQTVAVPLMVPALGVVSMVITWLAVAVPQALVMEYLIVSVPASKPVTTPEVLNVAMVGMADDHVPPVLVSLSERVRPWQTVVPPVIGATIGTARTTNLIPAVRDAEALVLHESTKR
jgi:hypothetical protein